MLQPLFITIIIPTFNRPKQLHACLQSLTRLDYPRERFEVIVVDDGSETPPTAAVSRFREYFNARLLAQPNAGPAAARNISAV